MTELEKELLPQLREMVLTVEKVCSINKKINETIEISGDRYNIETDGRIVPIVYYRTKRSGAPVIFAFHGGGFCFGASCMEDRLYDALRNRLNVNVVSVEYTKNAAYPTALNDCYNVILAMIADESFDFDREQISVFGSSAGANLALAVSIRAYREGAFRVRKRLLNYPYVDCATDPAKRGAEGHDLVSEVYYAWHYADNSIRKDPLISPFYGTEEDFDPDTESMLILAEIDTLYEQGEQFALSLQKMGHKAECVTAKGMPHGYFEYEFRGWGDYVPQSVQKVREDGSLKFAAEWAMDRFCEFFLQ